MTAYDARTAPSDALGETVEKLREAIALIDEINERSSSRAFNGIKQPLHAKLCTIRAKLARVAPLPMLGDHGTASQAIDYALAGANAAWTQETEFLRAWREGDLDEWPEFYEWLTAQPSSEES